MALPACCGGRRARRNPSRRSRARPTVTPPIDRRSLIRRSLPIAPGDRIALVCCAGGAACVLRERTGRRRSALGAAAVARRRRRDRGRRRRPEVADQRRRRARRRRRRVRRRDAGQLRRHCQPGPGRPRPRRRSATPATPDADRDGAGVANDAALSHPASPRPTANGCPAPPAASTRRPPVPLPDAAEPGRAVRAAPDDRARRGRRRGRPRRHACSTTTGRSARCRAPPYACTWRPTGADVGRATLLASAVDSDGRSTLGDRARDAWRASTAPHLTRRGRARTRVSAAGSSSPRPSSPALGCRGEVTVRVRGQTTRTVGARRATARTAPGSGSTRPGPRARFAGNPVVGTAT